MSPKLLTAEDRLYVLALCDSHTAKQQQQQKTCSEKKRDFRSMYLCILEYSAAQQVITYTSQFFREELPKKLNQGCDFLP
jgi:recombinational DNA repair protein RecR